MANIIQGDSCSFCHYYKVTRQDANDLLQIQDGFHIEKSYVEVQETWEQLQSGEL